MRKNFLIYTVLIAFSLCIPVFLKSGDVKAQGTGSANQNQQQIRTLSVSPTGNQIRNQNQNEIQVQNQGETTQIKTATQQMQQLMNMENLDKEIGQQIKTVAQEQVRNQLQIDAQVTKMETRSNFMRKIFGPDYKAVKYLNQQIIQNNNRIQQLQNLANQVENEGDQTQLKEAIQALVQENTALQSKVQAEEKVGGMFGWLLKLFV